MKILIILICTVFFMHWQGRIQNSNFPTFYVYKFSKGVISPLNTPLYLSTDITTKSEFSMYFQSLHNSQLQQYRYIFLLSCCWLVRWSLCTNSVTTAFWTTVGEKAVARGEHVTILHYTERVRYTTVCPASSDPFYIVTYYIKWVTTFWTHIQINFKRIYLCFFQWCGSYPVRLAFIWRWIQIQGY